MPAANSVVQRDFDDPRLDLHLTRRAVAHGIEMLLHLIETIGKIGGLEQRAFLSMLKRPSAKSVSTPSARSAKSRPPSVRAGYSESAAGASGAARSHSTPTRPRRRAPRHDVVQIETARFEPPLEDADQVALRPNSRDRAAAGSCRGLAQRHVLELAAECALRRRDRERHSAACRERA